MSHRKNNKPLLIFVRGLPGSGKSYLSEALIDQVGASRTLLLDPDAIDTENAGYKLLANELIEQDLNPAILPFRWLRQSACKGVSNGKIVIWNQPFTIKGVFDRLIQFIKDTSTYDGDLRVLVVEIEIDPIEAKQRIDKRMEEGGHGPDDETFAKRVFEYESFSDSYDTVRINGSEEINASVQKILKKIKLNF